MPRWGFGKLEVFTRCSISRLFLRFAGILLILAAAAYSACRDCAQPGFGGPAENPFTAYDALCRGAACQAPGYPQVFVNASNLSLFIRVVDLPFGGPAPGFTLERSYNLDDQTAGPFGTGWSFNLGDSLTTNPDGTVTLRRGSGRIDRFAPGAALAVPYYAMTGTSDLLTPATGGAYVLATPGSATTRVFRADGRLQAIMDGSATRVSLDYDSAGHLTTAHYRGRTINFSYDSAGHIASVADSANRTISFSYTADGRLAQQTNADGSTVAYRYDGSGNLSVVGNIAIAYASDPPFTSVAGITTPDGAVRQYAAPYDPAQISVTNGNGDATVYTSNPNGLLDSVTDAAGDTTSFDYDAAGHRTRVTNPAGQSVTFTYNSSGSLAGVTDAGGNRWTADYAAGLPAHITDPNGNVWTLKYDASGNLAAVTNPAAGATAATRSTSGQITALADPLGNKSSYQYDSTGLLTAFADALGGNWSYQYDGAARAGARTDPGGTVLSAAYNTGAGITALSSGDTQVAFDFSGLQRDALGRLTSYTDSYGNQITYQYDAAGQLTAMTLPGGNTVNYQYDHAHHLTQVSDWLGDFAVYSYDAAGRVASVTVSGGPVTVYQYGAAGRLRAIIDTGPDGTPVAAYRYTLDPNGNRTGVSALEPLGTPPPMAANSLVYNAANLPVSRDDGQTYQYDARGNLTSIQGVATLAYDGIGRLQSFNGAANTTYGYDATGLRTVRTVNGNARIFLYDASGAQPRVVMQTDGSGAPVAWYVYGLGLLWKVDAASNVYFYQFDGDGNVVALSNSSAGVVNQYRYDPTGILAASNETVENMFHARGQAGWVDDGNGLLYGQNRYWFPALRLTLPATANPSPPAPSLLPPLAGAGACFTAGPARCAATAGGAQ